MANVLTMDKEKDSISTEKKLESFMTRYRKPILISALVIVVAAIAVCVYVGIMDSNKKAGLAAVDSIEFTYTKDFDSLKEEEIVARQGHALDELKAYMDKKGVVGVRANMLAAEIAFAKKDFVNGKDYWIAAAEADKKSYTSPFCYYNAGVCYEETGDTKTAAEYYQMAIDNPAFLLVSRALFGLGRVREAEGNYSGAAEAYQKMVDEYGSDSWTNLAQTRLLQLKLDGKIN